MDEEEQIRILADGSQKRGGRESLIEKLIKYEKPPC